MPAAAPNERATERTEEHRVRVNVPDIATKQLAFRRNGCRRVLTVSSNFLILFGFNPGDRVIETSLGPGQGMQIEKITDLFTHTRHKKVYQRTYRRRRNDPLEAQLEVSSQKIIEESFPASCEKVHITFEPNCVTLRPIVTIRDKAMANAEKAAPGSTFAALTSGVDLASLRSEGFTVTGVLEWRPNEARDKQDLTETGALTALANAAPYALFNEDITCAALDRIADAMRKKPIMILHASPQCDDLSQVKGRSLKERDAASAESSADMVIDLLGIVERLCPPVVVFENVPGFVSSAAYEVASLRLRRWGYREIKHVGDARDYGGLTSRRRAYVIFTMLDAPLDIPEPTTPRSKDVWSVVERYIGECRDVTHSRSLQKGAEIGRLRAITPDSRSCPTPLKSQNRMCKDSVVIQPGDGSILFPSEDCLKAMLGIEDVDLSAVSETLASEIIGQSIDRPHHAVILAAIREHIASWLRQSRPEDGRGTIPNISCAPA